MGILSLFSTAPKDRPGVYCITNRHTGWFYIGATTLAMTERWDRHRYMLNTGRHHNKRLQADWDEYGSRTFKFSVIEVVKHVDQVFIREEYWQRRKHTNKCYNPHPDDMPLWVKKATGSKRTIEYSTPESQEALVTMFQWVPGSENELASILHSMGFPELVLLSCRTIALSRGPIYHRRPRR